MGSNDSETISLTSPSAIHVGPILTPGSNETISIVIPLSAQLTTVPNQISDQACKDCGKDFKQQSTIMNPSRQRGNNSLMGCPFPTCSRYGRAFSRAHDLKRHIARHEVKKEKVNEILTVEFHSCSDCGQDFMSDAVLQKHMQIHTKTNQEPNQEPMIQKTIPESITNEVKIYSCHLCKKRYTQETKLKVHLSVHEKESVSNICALCGSRFSEDEALQNHMKEHTDSIIEAQTALEKLETPPQLEQYEDSEFLLEEMLLLNKTSDAEVVPEKVDRNANNNSDKIRCDYCSKTFKSKWTLNSHVAAHEGRFQFDCNQCGKKFVRKSHYEGHMRSHEATRPYVCEQCGKTFKQLKHRREHTKRTHPGNQNAIQNLLDSITACVSEESSADQPKFTLLMPMEFNL